METLHSFIYGFGLSATFFSYVFLTSRFIIEKIYKDLDYFEITILILGPVGVIILGIIELINCDDY